jgi:chromosome segregation ATPase
MKSDNQGVKSPESLTTRSSQSVPSQSQSDNVSARNSEIEQFASSRASMRMDELTKLRADLRTSEKKLEKAEADLEEQAKILKELPKKVAQIETLNQEIIKLKKESEEDKNHIESQKEALEELPKKVGQIASLKQEIARLEIISKGHEDAYKEERLRQQERLAALLRLRKLLFPGEKEEVEAATDNDLLGTIEAEIKRRADELSKAYDKLEKAAEENKALNDQLTAANKAALEQEKRIEAQLKQNENLQGQLDSTLALMQQQKNEFTELLEKKDQEIDELKKTLEEANKKSADLEKEKSDLLKQIAELQRTLEAASDEIKKLNGIIKNLEEQNTKLKGENDDLRKQNNQLLNDNKDLQKKLDAALDAIKDLQEKSDKKDEKIAAKDAEIEALKKSKLEESDLYKKLQQINENTKEGVEYKEASDDINKTPNEAVMEILKRFKVQDTATELEENYAAAKRTDDEKKLNPDESEGWFNSNKLLRVLYKINKNFNQDSGDKSFDALVEILSVDSKNTKFAQERREILGEITIGDISVLDKLDDVERNDDGHAIAGGVGRKNLKKLLELIPQDEKKQEEFFKGFGYGYVEQKVLQRVENKYVPERSDVEGNFKISLRSKDIIPGTTPADATAESLLVALKKHPISRS